RFADRRAWPSTHTGSCPGAGKPPLFPGLFPAHAVVVMRAHRARPAKGMISMNLLRRAVALIAAAALAALVAAASACGGAATSTATPTNGLEKKSAADVLQETAAALEAAKSVHIVGTSPSS